MEQEDEQGPGHLVGADHADVDAVVISRITEAARGVAASADQVPAPDSGERLQTALQDASPDERSTAAKELADDPAAYRAMHDALRALGVEPE